MPRGAFLDSCCLFPRPGWPAPPWETPQHKQVALVQSLVGPLLPFPWVPVCAGFCLCFPRSLFAPILWKSCSQIPLACEAKFLGDSQSLCWIHRLGSWCGVQNLHNRGGTSLVLLFCSPVCGSSTWQVWVLILSGLYSSYCLMVASPLSLEVGYLLSVGSKRSVLGVHWKDWFWS